LLENQFMKYLSCLILFAAVSVPAAASAATDFDKRAWRQAQDGAADDFKAATVRCKALAGHPQAVCMAEAKAERVRVEQEATAFYKNTLKAHTQSRIQIASARFDLDKVKCGAMKGEALAVCVEQAKSTVIAAHADARADKKAIEARDDAPAPR
jgi:hypothetical protein